jgi:opacity protein-like surface antigen
MISRAIVPLALVTAALVVAAAPATLAGEIALEGQVGYFDPAFTKSASAVFGSTGGATFGGAARYTIGHGVFVSAGARSFSKDGERVFVATPAGPVSKLGFPLSMRITPIFLTVGYRFRDGSMLVPYLGIGGSINKYKETSTVAGVAYQDDISKAGFHGVAGLEVGRGLLRFAGEVSYSIVPNAIGILGVSSVYKEDNIGGFTAVGKLILAFHL